jgi:F0F1-type ATP synthase gamma subunit
MNLNDFKEIYKKYPTIKKIKAIYDVVDLISDAKVRKVESRNDKDWEYCQNEEVSMRTRLLWLINEITEDYTRMESRLKALEKRMAEAGEKQ